MYDVLKNFKTENEMGVWVIPHTRFFHGRWHFVSSVNMKAYVAEDFFMNSINPKLQFMFDEYQRMAVSASKVWTTSDFVCNWISEMVYLNATYHADKERVEYLEKNLTEDLPKKQVGKVHKMSEEIYSKEYDKYLKIYEAM